VVNGNHSEWLQLTNTNREPFAWPIEATGCGTATSLDTELAHYRILPIGHEFLGRATSEVEQSRL